jgi:hypothetical protein
MLFFFEAFVTGSLFGLVREFVDRLLIREKRSTNSHELKPTISCYQ